MLPASAFAAVCNFSNSNINFNYGGANYNYWAGSDVYKAYGELGTDNSTKNWSSSVTVTNNGESKSFSAYCSYAGANNPCYTQGNSQTVGGATVNFYFEVQSYVHARVECVEPAAPQKPTPPTGLSATCNASGNQVTLAWNANSGADNGYYVRLYSGGAYDQITDHYRATSITYPVTPGRYYDWWIHTEQSPSNYSDPAYGGFTCTAPVQYPNLIGYVGGAVNVTINQAVTLYGSVYNGDSGSAGASYGMIEVCDGNCATIHQYGSTYIGGIGSGGQVGVSMSYTPNSLNQQYYRVCADWNGNVTESNEGDNCSGWQSLTVSPPANQTPTGSLDAVTCDAAGGWAYDPDVPNSAIAVHFYVDGGYAGQMSAGEYRGDLAGYGNRYHGYTWAFPSQFKNGQQHSVTAYAIDSAGGANPALGTRYVTCAPPVVTPNPPTGLNASCNVSGTEATLSWTPTPGATYYYPRAAGGACPSGWQANGGYCIPNSNSINGTSISFGTTPGTTYSWWVHAGNSAGYSTPTESSFTCTGQPDLIGYVGSAINTTVNTAVTLYGSIGNSGTAASGASTAMIEVCDGGCSTIHEYRSASNGAIAANGSQSFSASYTPQTTVQLYYRTCADWNGNVTESNESNNCSGWQTLNATAQLPDVIGQTGSAASVVVNQAVTLTGSVYNAGPGAAGTFPNLIQVCNSGVTVCDTVTASSIGSLAVNATIGVSGSYTPSTTDRALYRTCANFNTSWQNVMSETNYGNNCSAWQTFTVQPAIPPAPTGLSATCNAAGTQATLSWSASSGATTYNPRVYPTSQGECTSSGWTLWSGDGETCIAPGDSYAGTSKVFTTIPGKNYALWVHAQNGTGVSNPSPQYGFTCTGQSDLIGYVGGAINTTVNTAVTLAGSVGNSGTGTAGASTGMIEVCDSGCSTVHDYRSAANSSIAPSGSQSFSVSYTPQTTVQLYYRTCADWNGNVTESNESNNCSGWQTLNASAQLPDLTGQAGSAVSATVNQAVTLSGSVYNAGPGAAGTFPNIIQVCNTAGTVCEPLATNTTGSLGVGATSAVSASYTPSSTDSKLFRTCANMNQSYTNIHSETNYGNNCSAWQTLNASAQLPDLIGQVGSAATVVVNQAVTLSGSVRNAGPGAAGTFPNFIQVCNAALTVCDTSVTNAIGSLAANATAAVSTSYTPSSTDRTQFRTCANMNASHVNVISETNYGNNCSAWQTLSVQPAVPPQPTGLSATCNASGTQVTMSWAASSGATFYYFRTSSADSTCAPGFQGNPSSPGCYPNPDSVTGTSVTYPTTPGRTYDWWVHAVNGTGYSAASYGAITCAGLPDLTSGSISPTTATAGNPVTFWGPATNSGQTTSGSFPMLFQVSQNGALFNSGYMAALAPAASAAGNANYTFPSAGTYQVRSCANYNTAWTAITTESNYDNNCGPWTDVVVAAAPIPTVSCTVSPSSIEPGQSVTYSANPAGGATSPYTWSASDGANVGTSATVTRTLTTPGMYGMSVRASGSAISYCPNVSVVAAYCTNATTNLSITATPSRVRPGQSTTISWSATGVNGQNASCSVSGPGVSWSSAVDASPSCSASGSANTSITNQSTYTLTCGGDTKSVTVNVIPNFTEF